MALWLYISNRENPRLVQDFPDPVPVTYSTLPDGLTLGNQTLGSVFLRIRRTDPNTPVTALSFHAVVDLAGLKAGTHRVPVQVVADPGIDVVSKRPAKISVTLEPKAQRRVPVKVEVLTRPPTGYGSSISFKPKSVTVSGPADLVNQVTHAAAYIDLGGFTSTVSGKYRLNAVNNSGSEVGSQVTLDPNQARITASVHAFSSYKTLPVLVEFSGLPKQGFGVAGVQVDPAEIAASGSPGSLSKVSAVQTSAISVNHRGGGSFTKTVKVNLPNGVSSHTHHVTVKVRIAPIQSSTSVEIGIQPKNVTPGLAMHTVPARVLVTVTGPANALHNVAHSTSATVDLKGYGPGVYQLHPTVKSSRKGLQVEAVYPRTVTVQLHSTG
jgi:YbbR domain-containing protein